MDLPNESILQRWLMLISDKKSLLEKMLIITYEKYSSYKEENFEEIKKLIEDRQGIIEKIDIIDLEINQLEKNHLQTPDKLSVFWCDIKEKEYNTLRVLDRIRQLDGQYIPLFQKQLYSLKNQQKNLRSGRKTVTAYNSRATLSQSLFVDEKE